MSNIIDSIQLSGVTYAIQGGGGGKPIEGGRGITVTTGETADTVSFNLPISAGTGTNSVIENSTTNVANGGSSHAEGFNTTAVTFNCHAEGEGTFASGQTSHAEGSYTQANGTGSHAEGGFTRAYSTYSHAEGYNTTGNTYSHAEGNATIASGQSSHAEGALTKAYGYASHTEGQGTIANNQSEHASGQWNVSNSASTTFGDSGNTLFSVGNGTYNARHNAFEIRQNGDIYLTSGNTDIKLQDALGGGGNPTVELTQAEYDALVTAGTVSQNTYYIITDATAGDLTQYWTSAQTQSAITEATSGKVDTSSVVSSVTSASTDSEIPTAKAVYDAVGQGGGGGTTYTAGRGIDITNDTISVSLPISAGTGSDSVIMGKATKVKASGNYSFAGGENSSATTFWTFSYGAAVKAAGQSSVAFGYQCYANSNQNFICGYFNNTNNDSEFGCGKYNISNTGSTASAQTLFSVGNGTSTSARHNAFEIRQNGDIYLNDGTNDVKLQDYLQIKAVKVTQAEYDALVSGGTVDANTLYIITNVVS